MLRAKKEFQASLILPFSLLLWLLFFVLLSFESFGVTAVFQRLRQAKYCFCRAVELSPGDADPWINMGVVYLAENDVRCSHLCFSTAQSSDPSIARAWAGQSIIASQSEGVGETLDLLRHALELYPHAAVCLAFAYRVAAALMPSSEHDSLQLFSDADFVLSPSGNIPKGSTSQYIHQAQIALVRYTSKPEGHADMNGYMLLALLDERMGMLEAAEAAARQALALCNVPEKSMIIKLAIARLLQKQHQLDGALQLYSEVQPRDVPQCCAWGFALFQAGQFEQSFEVRFVVYLIIFMFLCLVSYCIYLLTHILYLLPCLYLLCLPGVSSGFVCSCWRRHGAEKSGHPGHTRSHCLCCRQPRALSKSLVVICCSA